MMQRILAVLTLILLLSMPTKALADTERAAAIQDVAKDLPTLPPDLIWEEPLLGRTRSNICPPPTTPIDQQLDAAIKGLAAGWSPKGYRTDWTGAICGFVTHLAAPGEPPRAIFWLSDGHLYLIEQRSSGWQTRRLTQPYADTTAVVDLSGDGQPEIIAATQLGSGAVLTLQILAWDKERVWTAFTHTGAKEPGIFGWFDAEGDGKRELWIDTGSSRGLFTDEQVAHSPFMRDRLIFRWADGTYRQTGRYRFATPLYHLNRYLYLASQGDWHAAARHAEPGAQIDRKLVAELGLGPFAGGSDLPFVNGRIYFTKGNQAYYADFGRTGRLIRLVIGDSERDRLWDTK